MGESTRRWPIPWLRALLGMSAVTLLTILHGSTAYAQVGHPPGHSPYRDIFKGHTFTPIGGYIGGSGGRFEIGPHDGSVFGFRYDIRTASAIQMGLQLARADLDRLIVNPFVVLENRVSGPVKQTVTFAEVDLQFNITGGKTWHGLAPFVGAAGGLTFASGTPADTSDFNFGKKIYFAPHAGLRLFLTQRLHLRADARVTFWKLKYPASFEREPPDQPGTADHPNAVITDGRTEEWITGSWLQAGLGYSFSP
jgi:hypothetical protein